MNTYELFTQAGITKINVSKQDWQKVVCPKCSHTHSSGKKNNRDLAIKLEDGAYKCHRCDWSGNILIENQEQKYERPKEEIINLSTAVKAWLESRQIDLEVAKMFKVGSKSHNGRDLILFNYHNLYGQHANIKARDINDKSYQRQSKGAEKTPYGAQFIKNAPYILITEGEPDVLAWATAGVYYAISGNNGSSDESWIETIYDVIEGVEKIYIAVDNDGPGAKYEKNLARRFPKEKLYTINYGDYNDANEILIQNGKEQGSEILKHLFNQAEPIPVPEIEKVVQHMEDAMEFFINGYPETKRLGIDPLDQHFSLHHELILVSGTPNAGKSNFVDFLVTSMAKKYGVKAGIFTGEEETNLHLSGLAYKWIERSREVMDPSLESDRKQFFLALSELNDYVYYFSEGLNKIDDLLDYGLMMVQRYGVSLLVLDNWTVIEKSVPSQTDAKDYYGTVLSRLKNFAKQNQCAVVLVAHPRKVEEINGQYKIPNGYDIYGTSHFFNLIDTGISFRANDGFTEYQVWKVRRQNFVGKPGFGRIRFEKDKGGIYTNFAATNRFDDYISTLEVDDTPF